MSLEGNPGNYNLGLLTNRTDCTFDDAAKSIAAIDVGSIFPPNEATPAAGNATRIARSVVRLPLFDLATYISLNLPMQSFNIVDMFDPGKASFTGVLDCSVEDEMLTVRDVVQESRCIQSRESHTASTLHFHSRIRLTSDLFNESVTNGSGEVFDFCGRNLLFMIRNMDTGEIVLFGRKDHTDTRC